MKMQEAVKKIPGVKDCEVSFMKQKMTLEADDADFDKIVKLAVKAIAKVEPDCTVLL
jgi:copper chaperone CopZ